MRVVPRNAPIVEVDGLTRFSGRKIVRDEFEIRRGIAIVPLVLVNNRPVRSGRQHPHPLRSLGGVSENEFFRNEIVPLNHVVVFVSHRRPHLKSQSVMQDGLPIPGMAEVNGVRILGVIRFADLPSMSTLFPVRFGLLLLKKKVGGLELDFLGASGNHAHGPVLIVRSVGNVLPGSRILTVHKITVIGTVVCVLEVITLDPVKGLFLILVHSAKGLVFTLEFVLRYIPAKPLQIRPIGGYDHEVNPTPAKAGLYVSIATGHPVFMNDFALVKIGQDVTVRIVPSVKVFSGPPVDRTMTTAQAGQA